MLTKTDIIEALKRYDYTKYSEEFYEYYLNEIKKSYEPTTQLKDNIKYLILWFLGKISEEKPEIFIKRVYVNNKKYYILKTTPNNDKAIDKALEDINIWAGLSFKNGHLTYNNFMKYANSLTKNSIVIPSFYVHIFNPEKYPIMNDKVWKVYTELVNKSVYINTKPALWNHYNQYINFCNYLHKTLGLSLRDIDKGLWVLGNDLKNKVKEEVQIENMQFTIKGIFEGE